MTKGPRERPGPRLQASTLPVPPRHLLLALLQKCLDVGRRLHVLRLHRVPLPGRDRGLDILAHHLDTTSTMARLTPPKSLYSLRNDVTSISPIGLVCFRIVATIRPLLKAKQSWLMRPDFQVCVTL